MTQPEVPAPLPSVGLQRDKVTATSLAPPGKRFLGCAVPAVWDKLLCEAEVGYQGKVLFPERGGELGRFPRE